MKVLIFSDIHARIDNIIDVFENNSFDEYVFAGDLFGYFLGGRNVLDLFMKFNVKFVLGNHDLYFLREIDPIWFNLKFNHLQQHMISSKEYDQRYGFLHESLPEIKTVNLDFLKSANLSSRISIDGLDVFICHGSPSNPFNEYVYPDYDHFDELFDNTSFDVLVLGHTHKSFVKKMNNRFIMNPGSCTLPRGEDSPSYIIFDTIKLTANIYKIKQSISFVRETKSKLKLI